MKPDLEKIVEQYGTMISSISHRMIQNKEVAKEAAQEVWYEIIRSIGSFNGQSELSTWIYTICKRTILRYARNERIATMNELKEFRDLPAIDPAEQDRDEHEWIKKCCDWCLTAQLHCLTNDARLIFIFKINLNLSHKQISEIMGMTEDNIRQISSGPSTRLPTSWMTPVHYITHKELVNAWICKQVNSLNLEKEYTAIKKIIRLVDVYQRLEKELPRKNYWEKFIS